jgi:hypothetical protein
MCSVRVLSKLKNKKEFFHVDTIDVIGTGSTQNSAGPFSPCKIDDPHIPCGDHRVKLESSGVSESVK